MNKQVDCEVVCDLLPSYADGLTSDVTRKLIDEHLENCAECSEVLRRMKEPEPLKAVPVEVDYLKKVRRHTNSKSLLIGIALMLLGMVMLSFRIFYVGSEAAAKDTVCHVSVEGDTVTVTGRLTSSGQAVSRVAFSSSGGIVRIKAYTVPKTFFNKGEFNATYTGLSPIEQVRMDDFIIWENGVEIGTTASQLFAAANPFVGDMPSNSRIATILGVPDQFGPYTNELQTSKEPYGWTIILEEPVLSDEEKAAKEIMTADSYAMLAAIDNLGYVMWQYVTEAEVREFSVTAEEATAFAGRDIKQFSESVSDLQKLLQSLSFKWSGVRELLQETGKFSLKICNYSSDDVYGIGLNYYLDGVLIGSCTGESTRQTPLKEGEVISYDFTPADFPEDISAIKLYGFSFDLSVIDSNGKETVVRENIELQAKYAWRFFYTLAGNYADGFTLYEG